MIDTLFPSLDLYYCFSFFASLWCSNLRMQGRQWCHIDPYELEMGNCTEAIKCLSCASVFSNFSCSSWKCLWMFPQDNTVCVHMTCVYTWQCERDMRDILVCKIISMKIFDMWTTLTARVQHSGTKLSCRTYKECSSKIYPWSRHCFAESCKLEWMIVHVTMFVR